MTIKYRAYNGEIERVEILRESTNTVYFADEVLGEIYHAIKGVDGYYCDTWDEAHERLKSLARGAVEFYEGNLERAQRELMRVEAMEQNNG